MGGCNVKRLMDISLSLVALGVLLIPGLVIILILKITGDKQAFFFQTRVGQDKQPFTCWKLVTMWSGSEKTGTGAITIKNDPRVTRLGQFLRKTKINELPQFINVLKGDMSLVGPRPLTPEGFDFYTPEIQDIIGKVKPGLTGIGSIVFRDEEQMLGRTDKPYEQIYREDISPIKGALETRYIQHFSIWLDLKILMYTLIAVVYPRYQLNAQALLGLSDEQWEAYDQAMTTGHYANAAPAITTINPTNRQTETTINKTPQQPASKTAIKDVPSMSQQQADDTNHDNFLTPKDKLLVIGGSGFIGTHFHAALEKAGIQATNFDLHPMTPKRPGVISYEGDIRDYPALEHAMRDCTAVINLAAAHHDFGISQETFESVNIDGPANVCRAMSYHGITKACFFSSVAVYGMKTVNPDEHATPDPENPYGRTKLAGECEYANWLGEGPGRRCLIIRPAVVFGPNNFANMFRLINQIDSNRFFPVGSGENTKSMCFVRNIIDAVLYLWSKPPAPVAIGDGLEIYNYTGKPDLTSKQIITTIYNALGKKQPSFSVPYSLAILLCQPFDLIAKLTGKNLPITAARVKKLAGSDTPFQAQKVRDAGFVPETPLTTGIEEMVKWYIESGKHTKIIERIPPEWHPTHQARAEALQAAAP